MVEAAVVVVVPASMATDMPSSAPAQAVAAAVVVAVLALQTRHSLPRWRLD